MAIALECINFIVPISVIREKYPGGWRQCLRDHEGMIGGRVWHDEHLFRDGAMSPMDMMLILDRWKRLGIQATEELDGELVWRDCCIVPSMLGEPTLPCDWIEIIQHGRFAQLKGTGPSTA